MANARVMRILVVSGDGELLASAPSSLSSRGGVQVLTAQSAEAGLKMMARAAPSLMFVDLDLPDRDGAWLLKRIRDDYVGRPPRIVLIADPGLVSKEIAELRADAIIVKPVTPAVLSACAASFRVPEPTGASDIMRSLVQLTLLSADLEGAAWEMTVRLSRALQVSSCLISARTGDIELARSSVGPMPGDSDPIWLSLQAALATMIPVLEASGQNGATTSLAIPIESVRGERSGFVLFRDNRARLFGRPTVDRCRDLGRRLHAELSWLSVHQRIAADRDKLRQRSQDDPMLGVWTRSALEERLPPDIAACQKAEEPAFFAILDVASIRDINRRFGHAAGDAVLKHVAATIRGTLGPRDRIARYSGDRFALFLPGLTIDAGLEQISQIQRVVRQPLTIGKTVINAQVVAGVSSLIGLGDSGIEALARAAAATEVAKERDRPFAVFDATMDMISARAFQGLDAGMTLGGMYQVLHEISRGSMGVVYRAEDLGLGRPVALKTLRPDLAKDDQLVELFKREAATVARLRHENLVQVHAFGVDHEQMYFAMELVEGESLEDRIDDVWCHNAYMPFAQTRQIIQQIASALSTMHSAGILHRDVKPANILLDRELDRAVLVDFGIATGDTSELPAGTPGFAAPEIFRGERPSPAADVYGLAVTAYAMLTNTLPYELDPENLLAVVQLQQSQVPAKPTTLRPTLPPAVDNVLLKALHNDPQQRFGRAEDFSEAMLAALSTAVEELRLDDRDAGAHNENETTPLRRRPAAGSKIGSMWHEAVLDADSGLGIELELDAEPMTRGILFRAAHQLGITPGAHDASGPTPAETMVGAGWIQLLQAKKQELAEPLGPNGERLGWYPTRAFGSFLAAIENDGKDARTFARALGRCAASTTFLNFFGADPASLSLAEVINATKVTWHQYHSWGELEVLSKSSHEFDIVIKGVTGNELVCESTIGIFDHILSVSGAKATVTHTSCCHHGGSACTFHVTT